MGSHHSKRRSPTELQGKTVSSKSEGEADSITSKVSESSTESQGKPKPRSTQQEKASSIDILLGFGRESQNSVDTASKMSEPQLQFLQMLNPLRETLTKLSKADSETQFRSLEMLKPLIDDMGKLSEEICVAREDKENGNPTELKSEKKGAQASKIPVPIRKPTTPGQSASNTHDTSANLAPCSKLDPNLSSKISERKIRLAPVKPRKATAVRVPNKASNGKTVTFNSIGTNSRVRIRNCPTPDSTALRSTRSSRPLSQSTQWARLACEPRTPCTTADQSEQIQYREQYDVSNSTNYEQEDSDEVNNVQGKQMRQVNSSNAFHDVRPTTTSSRPATSSFRPTTSGYQRPPTSLPEILLGATKTTRILTRRVPKSQAMTWSSTFGQCQYPTCFNPYPYQSHPYSQRYFPFPPFPYYPYRYPYGGYPNYGYFPSSYY